MTRDRLNDTEIQNILDVSPRSDLPPSTKALIAELFERVKGLESPSSGDHVLLLRAIVDGMNGDLVELGESPSNANLRDRVRSVTTAVRDLAECLADQKSDQPRP